ncbi:MAG: hypothetical protein V7707_18585 [Motiliproteus sp.]
MSIVNDQTRNRFILNTNGPEFSQIPKLEAVSLAEHVDHFIIGGQEPEQKPARSIFDKALTLANRTASERNTGADFGTATEPQRNVSDA